MKLRFVFVMCLTAFYGINAAAALTPQQVATTALTSTVLIKDPEGHGSGFVIGPGQIATNYHVIEGVEIDDLTVTLVKETAEHPVDAFLAIDRANDLAILKVSGISAPALTLGNSDTVQIGQSAYVAGTPAELDYVGTFSDGIISAIRPEGNEFVAGKILQMTTPITGGNSGGPVLDTNAKVIGIVVSTYLGGQNINFAVAVNLLKTLIAKMTTTVTIPDTNLRTAIEAALGKAANAPITVGEMKTIFTLEATDSSISDLTGLEHAASLTGLDLANNSISDISPLENLQYLESLDLANNSISDFSALGQLINLRELRLENNPIGSTFPLCRLQEEIPELQLDIDIACESYYLLGWLWDVDEDGVIDLFDLDSLIADLFEQDNTGDINDDGRTDFQDLVVVADDIDESETSAGPSTLVQFPMEVQVATVRTWIDIAHSIDDGSPAFRDGIANLKRFLDAMRPNKTELFANYPNPFNPETWIPYRLTNATDVQISIYDTNGALVRQLDLGYQRAGYYTDKTKAAYWDGRNQRGELVASGVYFFHLSAGDYFTTRRMVILK